MNVEHGDAVRVVPEDDAIARAIASVPGVAEAGIVRPDGGGRGRLTLRLHPGEDDQRVAWAVAATLRERFDIDLDPEAIRPRMTATDDPDHDPVAVVRTDGVEGAGPAAEDGATADLATDALATGDGPSDGAAQRGATHDAATHDGTTHDGATHDAATHHGSGAAPPQVPWPPRDRPWTAREPLDPPPNGAAAASAGTGIPAPAGTPAAAFEADGGETTAPGQPIQLRTTRERLSRAVEDALAGLVAPPDDVDAAPDAAPETDLDGAPAAAFDAASDVPDVAPDAAPAAPSVAPTAVADPPAVATAPRDAAALRPPRAVIEHLEVRRSVDTVEVTVTLRHEDHRASGTASAVATSKGRMRATAEATVAAVHALVQASLVVGVDRIVLTDAGDDVTVSVVLTMVTAGDEQRLLGGAIVRDDTDAEGAVVRATLDALNRRVVPLLVQR